MMKRKKAFTILILLILIVFLSGCEKNAKPEEKDFFAMDTFFSFSVYGDADVLDECEKLVRDLENDLSVTINTSCVSRLNETGSLQPTEEFKNIVSECIRLCELTSGYFDVTVYPAVYEWGFTTGNYKVLTEDESDSLLSKIGYEKINISSSEISLENSMKIDLGGIAKGYCSDKIIKLAKEKGIRSGIFNLGGNVYALGKKPNGDKWKVGIQDPFDENSKIGVFHAENTAIVTSGNYERFFEKDGVTYGHIIDPFTARPAETDLASVTVIGENGTECDAFSTALFVMGMEKSMAFASENDLNVILVTKAGEIYVSEKIRKSFDAAEKYSEKIHVF